MIFFLKNHRNDVRRYAFDDGRLVSVGQRVFGTQTRRMVPGPLFADDELFARASNQPIDQFVIGLFVRYPAKGAGACTACNGEKIKLN